MEAQLEAIEEAVDVFDLLDHLGLRHTMRQVSDTELRGPCPIHGGDNPGAFAFYLDRKIFYCYTRCNEGGGVIRFVQKVKKCSFKDAAIYLANLFGVSLEIEGMADEDIAVLAARERHIKFFKMAAQTVEKYFRQKALPLPLVLPEEPPMQGRFAPTIPDTLGLKAETWQEFDAKFCLEDAYKGPFQEGRWKYPQGFLSRRTVLPIRDKAGRTVGFVGRKTHKWQEPKYLYSPGLLKSHVLFGSDKALPGMIETGIAVVTEGPKDVLGLWERGVRNAVAALGCDLHPEQVATIYHYVSEFWIAFDGDEAGDTGALKAAKELAQYGIVRVYRVPMPEGKDPDELSREEWDACVAARRRL